MRVSDFDFDLPEDRIALRPTEPREAARLLIVSQDTHVFEDRQVRDLPFFLRAGDAIVVNDTRVIRARLRGTRTRGASVAKIEVMLHQRVDARSWLAFVRPAKKLEAGEVVRFSNSLGDLSAVIAKKADAGDVLLEFDCAAANLDAAIAIHGELPLPPYIAGKRAVDAQDTQDYQTIFAAEDGAVAAPTAGLHLTEALLKQIKAAGASIHQVTLHVGAGTFLPVKVDDTDDHVMHGEWGRVSAETAAALNLTRERGGRIIAVGTTSLRLLESAADASGKLHPFADTTKIFITPGYSFRAVDVLMTNFHLPKSTLFMLVSAFCGQKIMKAAYQHAITQGYRFYSYGDASLLIRSGRA